MGLRPVAIVGPTASGKTRRAVQTARVFNGEILSCDSRQVYRGMTIGTGKDLDEYNGVKYHLVDICEAGDKYNLHRFLSDFHQAFDDVDGRGKRVVMCGGSGMYVESALSGIRLPVVEPNPELRRRLEEKSLEELTEILRGYKRLHNTTDIDTAKRAIRAIEIEEYYRSHPEEAVRSRRDSVEKMPALIIGVDIDREERRNKITQRLHARLDEGMLDEVRRLLDSGIAPEDLIYYGLEYKFLTLHIIGRLSYDEMVRQLEIAIHQFAKRQMTWFRGMERRGFDIHWIDAGVTEQEFIEEVGMLL